MRSFSRSRSWLRRRPASFSTGRRGRVATPEAAGTRWAAEAAAAAGPRPAEAAAARPWAIEAAAARWPWSAKAAATRCAAARAACVPAGAAGAPRRSAEAARCAAWSSRAARGALARLVDDDGATAHRGSVELGDDGLRLIRLGHLDEREAARLAGLAIGDDFHVGHRSPVLPKERPQVQISGSVRNVSYVEPGTHACPLKASFNFPKLSKAAVPVCADHGLSNNDATGFTRLSNGSSSTMLPALDSSCRSTIRRWS